MSVEVHAGDRMAGSEDDGGSAAATERDRRRPNLSGDLPTLFEAAPMFRRALAGYDRFQVDTYAEWVEHELATADREREHLMARHLRTQADLKEARRLLAHSAGGGQFLEVSERIGSMLAAATDEAEKMRAEAAAVRSAAATEAADTVAAAERTLADAAAQAERLLADAADEARRSIAEARTAADEMLDQAERVAGQVRADVAARLERVCDAERSAAEQIEKLRRQAEEEASAARLQARADVVGILTAGREQRRRADAEAAVIREQMERDTSTRRAQLLAEIEALELRRAALRADVAPLPAPVIEPTTTRTQMHLPRLLLAALRRHHRNGLYRYEKPAG